MPSKKTTRPNYDDNDTVACSAPIKMRSSYVSRVPLNESPVSESYYGSKMHRFDLIYFFVIFLILFLDRETLPLFSSFFIAEGKVTDEEG